MIATGAAGEAGSLPSQSPNGASVSAAASGAVCQWQTSSTDRRGSGDRPLGNVPPGRSGPKGRAKYVRRKKFAQSLVSPPPLGGRWCPVGTVQRLTEPAGESAPVGGGEGQPQVAPGPKMGKWHCWAQTCIKPGFFANSAKFSFQAVGRREGRSLLGEIDKF